MTDVFQLKGRPRDLAVLDYGLFRVHANGRVIGISGFLIRTDAGEHVLVDTGFPPAYAVDPQAASEADNLGEFGEVLALTAENLPLGQLALLGLGPQDIDLLILTHSHIDHVGGLAGFPGVPVLMAAAERALPRPLYWGAAQPMDWPEADYHLLAGDADLAPGFRVLLVPGHAPGQLALLLDLPQTGRVLITSDAISRPAEVVEGFAGAHDPAQAAASAARLMALAEGAFVIWGHAPDQWPKLRKAPLRYG
ncbi:MBL fold metallo-hydrolase [Fertoebacter nigrum]|uniref:MBL fold metallo-hydrolase n=1 Tax=Fertoeibacter niger TaxID=2656921 RepID=A0A8X8KNR6_9RHOB|nr:MBL fold metallo-hydrolase [Fertoeibacter niger]NUB45290.1 MBL fold metallo-hydrolase [Fertoeibacter niger]